MDLSHVKLVRYLRQSIGYIFIIALFIGSGSNGACSLWSVVGIDHDHHEGREAVVVFEDVDHCEQPSVPCDDANEELPDLQLSIPGVSQKQFVNSVVGFVPVPATEFRLTKIERQFEPLLYYDFFRPLPVSRRLVFCRFII